QLALALGHVWAAGVELDAAPLFDGRDAALLTLPPTPLDTQPYWSVERKPAEPLRLPTAAQEMTQMDPLVALFREQVALLQQQAKVLEQQAAALAGKGVAVPQLPLVPQLLHAVPAAAPAFSPPAAVESFRPAAPPSDDRVAKTVFASVARISAFPLEAIKPSQTLAGDLGFDSLMTVELDGDVNKAFPGSGG